MRHVVQNRRQCRNHRENRTTTGIVARCRRCCFPKRSAKRVGKTDCCEEPHVSAFGEEQGLLFRQPLDSLRAEAPCHQRVTMYLLSGVDRSFAPLDGSMHPHCEPYPANDKRYLNSVLTKKTASATHRTIQPSIRPDLNTICSSPKIEMGGKIFLDCTPIVGLKKFRFDDRRCGSFLGLSRFDCPLAKTGGTVNGGA